MSNPKHHALIGAAVTDAVERFCATRGASAENPGEVREAQRKSPAVSPTFGTPAAK